MTGPKNATKPKIQIRDLKPTKTIKGGGKDLVRQTVNDSLPGASCAMPHAPGI
jgi:hypothetical protein